MSNTPNTLRDFELEDGQTVKMTLAYIHLYRLKGCKPDVYKRYNEIMTQGAKDEFDNIELLYTGYLCGLLAQGQDVDEAMDYEEFMSLLPVDRDVIGLAVAMMIAPKKAMDSAALS